MIGMKVDMVQWLRMILCVNRMLVIGVLNEVDIVLVIVQFSNIWWVEFGRLNWVYMVVFNVVFKCIIGFLCLVLVLNLRERDVIKVD